MNHPRVPLGELVTFQGGGTPRRDEPAFWNGGIPWASVKDLTGLTISSTQEYISAEGLRQSASTLVPAGSLIMATRMAVGRVAMSLVEMAINQDLKALTPHPQVDVRYLLHYLRASEAKLMGASSGATVKGITIARLSALPVPLPPLAEQRRIAGVLDRVEGVRGRCVERHRLMKSFGTALFIKHFGEPVANPFGWPILHLGSCLADKPRIGTVRPATDDGTYPVVRVGELGSRTVMLRDSKRVKLRPDELLRFETRSGDVLIARAIGSESHLGKASILQATPQQVAFDSHVMRLRLDLTQLRPEYFWHLIQTPGGRSLLLRRGGRTAVQFNINAEQIATMRIPIPPIALQERFALLDERLLVQQELRAKADAGMSEFHTILARHTFRKPV